MIEVITEFTAKATIRSVVYVYDDDDALVEPTSVLITWAEPKGPRSGVATATTADHLIDTVKNQFTANDVGKVIYNVTDKTTATITEYNSPSDVTLDTDIMAEGESYELYCVYEDEIVVDGKVEDGIYEHFYNTTVDSAKGYWQGLVEVIDGEGDTARTSIGNYSVKVK
mgnify:CR=1 FL=1